MIRKQFLFIGMISLLVFSPSYAQNWWEGDTTSQKPEMEKTSSEPQLTEVSKEGKVTIHADKKIDALLEFKQATIPPNEAPMQDGFRVQLFFDQDKENVNKARGEVLKIDKEYDVYIEYKAPNYNLLLGNYRTRLEAEKEQARLSNDFPEAIVIATRIYLPAVKRLN